MLRTGGEGLGGLPGVGLRLHRASPNSKHALRIALLAFVILGLPAWWFGVPHYKRYVTQAQVQRMRSTFPQERVTHEPTPDAELVFFANYAPDRFCLTLRSAIHSGHKRITVLGLGESFPGGRAGIFRNKVKRMRQYMTIIESNQIVAFIDSFDSILFATPSELLDSWHKGLQYMNATTSILIGGEKNLYPATWLQNDYDRLHSPTANRFINSGVYMGRAGELSAALTRAEVYEQDDDQLSWQLTQLDNPGAVQLDHYNHLVNNMYLSCSEVSLQPDPSNPPERFNKEGNSEKLRPYNRATKTFPAILHFNGPSGIDCKVEHLQRTAWWWNGVYLDDTPEEKRKAEQQKQQKRESEYEIFLLGPTLYLTRTQFNDICPPRVYFK